MLTPSPTIVSAMSVADDHENWSPFEGSSKQSISSPTGLQHKPPASENGSEVELHNIIPYETPKVVKRRHHKPKVMTEAQRVEKRTIFLTRNREAASRCRKKKKDWLDELQDDAKTAKMENEALQKAIAELMDEVLWLRSHVGTRMGCDCQRNEGR
jgi:hypothetical protein